jgi:hypothetical protein
MFKIGALEAAIEGESAELATSPVNERLTTSTHDTRITSLPNQQQFAAGKPPPSTCSLPQYFFFFFNSHAILSLLGFSFPVIYL